MHRMESGVRKSNKENTTKSHKKLVKVQKPPSNVSAIQKHKPGMYKGRVVRSKVDCFRKPKPDVKTTEKKVITKLDVTRPKPEWPKVRCKSVSSLSASSNPRVNPAVSSRPRSVSDLLLNGTDKPVQVCLKLIPQSVPRTVTRTGACALPGSAPPAAGRSVTSKPLAPKKNQKPNTASAEQKPCRTVMSTVRRHTEQINPAEERRAEFAEWKGKTLKKPPVLEKSATFPGNPKPAPRPKTGPKPTIGVRSDPVVRCRSGDVDVPADPEMRMESLVLSLCDEPEAVEMPSSREDAGVNVDKSDVAAEKTAEVQEESEKVFEVLEEQESNITEDTKNAAIKNDEDYQEPKEKQPFESEDDERMKNTTAKTAGASIVKYNVKTTPYLQKLKKKIECATAPGSGSRRRNIIKELKFLTPVRRSTRIQHMSSRLPGLLSDHDTCVSSLTELMQRQDAEANAYIYRKNPALLEELPDHPEDLSNMS